MKRNFIHTCLNFQNFENKKFRSFRNLPIYLNLQVDDRNKYGSEEIETKKRG